jgi:purine-binding chemotaxis protein CheW
MNIAENGPEMFVPPRSSEPVDPNGNGLSGPKNIKKYVTFYFGDKLCGVAAASVAEVSQPLRITPLPNAPKPLLGISALRGEVVAVINLKRMLGSDEPVVPTKSKLIILHSNEGDTQIAFAVDRMHEVLSIAAEDIRTNGSNIHFAGTAAHVSGNIDLIETASLPASLETSRQAAPEKNGTI